MTAEKSFRFKQFAVRHDRCAMKVGTDGVLLGAWANVEGSTTALDIGTGTGLIALMLAQRNAALSVTGIDIDSDAVKQAQENVQNSPWARRINIEQADFTLNDEQNARYDLIVSNPPFHTEDTLNPDATRTAARHTCSLPFPVLIRKAATLLTAQGHLCLIVPTATAPEVVGEAAAQHLYLSKRTDVKTTPRKTAKRTLLEFTPNITQTVYSILTLQDEHQKRTGEYMALTQDFYL
ncbi:MAG: methyltransferase [Bacteroidaceae bacterium]|nr:methyltransferase [Bacteroidaceae bacterium]